MILSYLLLCITLFYDYNRKKKVAILFHVFEQFKLFKFSPRQDYNQQKFAWWWNVKTWSKEDGVYRIIEL